MTNRILAFYAVAIVVVLIASYFQNLYFPAVPKGAQQETNSVTAEDSEQADESLAEDSQLSFESDQAVEDHDNANVATVSNESAPADSDSTDSESSNNEEAKTVAQKDAPELYSIGSLAIDSPFRYLVTLDSSGGTVRRVELNFRKKNGKYKYRDLEYEGGYLGELDCVDTADGCKARVVGAGTPAAAAGLKSGDIILSIDSEPVVSAVDLSRMLEETKPGQTISVTVSRNKIEGASEPDNASDRSQITCQVLLTDKPIELIRPQPDILNKGWPAEPSFQTRLRLKKLAEIWPELDSNLSRGGWRLQSLNESQIAFTYTISKESLQQQNLQDEKGNSVFGPIKLTKTYALQEFPVTVDPIANDTRTFHFDLTLQIENQSEQKQELTYQLDGPLGTPSETWWYQNKIHGRNSAIGYVAGARDIAGSTGQEEFTFFGCPEIVANLRKSSPKYFWLLKPPSNDNSADQQVNYVSVDTQYFNVALIPKNQGQTTFSAYSVLADTVITDVPKQVKEQKLVDCTFRMFKLVELEPKQTYEQTFEVFAGPKEADLLAQYALDDVRSFGWFALFSKPLVWLLELFHKWTFQIGYGIPIILLTVLVRCLMIPISRKAALNAQMMQYLQPQMKELAEKYKDDMEKRGQAQRDLFKKYNYNPFSGCFMMFFQIPIFIGLYRGLSVDVALRDQPLLPGLGWCSNLSAPDQLWYWKDTLPGFLSILTDETGWLGPYLNILPIITCVLFVVQQKMFTPPPTDEQQEMMHKVMKYAMIFMGLLFFKVPSGLCLYFITSSMWGIAERKMLPKPELDKSKLDELPKSDDAENKVNLVRKAKQEAKELKAQQQRADELDQKKKRDKERKKRLKQRGA